MAVGILSPFSNVQEMSYSQRSMQWEWRAWPHCLAGISCRVMKEVCWPGSLPLRSGFKWGHLTQPFSTGICPICQLEAHSSPRWGWDVRILEPFFVELQIAPLDPRHSGASVWRQLWLVWLAWGRGEGVFALVVNRMTWSLCQTEICWAALKMKIFKQSTIKRALQWHDDMRGQVRTFR